MRTDGAVCKGSWELGSACGRCQKCAESIDEAARVIKDLRQSRDKCRMELDNCKDELARLSHIYVVQYDGDAQCYFRTAELARGYLKGIDEPGQMWRYTITEVLLQ